MRIAINALAVDGGGGQTYLLNIVHALCRATVSHEFWVILARRHRELLPLLPPRARPVICRSVLRPAWLRLVWEQIALPWLLRRWRVDLLYANNIPVLLSPVPMVVIAQNVEPYSREPLRRSLAQRMRLVVLRVLMGCSARVARYVVFVSHTSARVMAPHMRVPTSQVRVVHHGWPDCWEAPLLGSPASVHVPKPYVLAVADLNPNKNLELLLEAFDSVVAQSRYPGHLVVVGAATRVSGGYEHRLTAVRERLRSRDRIHLVGRVPRRTLLGMYVGADLLVFPSLEETFGLPMLEAMGAGVPVAASDWRLSAGADTNRSNVAPEICGEAAEFFDPLAPASLAAAMRRVLGDPERRAALVQAGKIQAEKFSWERAATALLTIFEEAAAGCATPPGVNDAERASETVGRRIVTR